MVSVTIGATTQVEIDYVAMYTGDEAIEKALEDGSDVVEMDEHGDYYIPNDYYIRNNNPVLRTFPLANDCEVYMIPPLGGPEADLMVSFEELRDAVLERQRLMNVVVFEGFVVLLEEFYLP